MARWYFVGPMAVIAAIMAGTVDPMYLPVGALAVLLPVWAYRSRGSRSAEHMARQMAYEMQDSLQTAFGVASAILFALFLSAQVAFDGMADMLGILGGQLATVPLPVAYVGTTALGLVGLGEGSLSPKVFAGWAIIAFAVAIAVKRM